MLTSVVLAATAVSLKMMKKYSLLDYCTKFCVDTALGNEIKAALLHILIHINFLEYYLCSPKKSVLKFWLLYR